tara:strand:- start:853 stop:1044 length:192 start_codon:yes stop_codon:yes gene_type:complete
MKNKSKKTAQPKTTFKWDANGELSSIDMTRIIDVLSVTQLKECELACSRPVENKEDLNLGMWW